MVYFSFLAKMSILEEMNAAPTVRDVLFGHPMYINVAVQYVRPKQVTYVKETLQGMIRAVVEEDGLDLEVDPVVVCSKHIGPALTDPRTRSTALASTWRRCKPA